MWSGSQWPAVPYFAVPYAQPVPPPGMWWNGATWTPLATRGAAFYPYVHSPGAPLPLAPNSRNLIAASVVPPLSAPRPTSVAEKIDRTGPLKSGECVVCTNELPPTGGIAVDVSRVLGCESLPLQWFCCDPQCRRALEADKLDRPKGARVKRALDVWATAILGTDLRKGDDVTLMHDYSTNRRVEEGDAVVTGVRYDAALQTAEITAKHVRRSRGGQPNA